MPVEVCSFCKQEYEKSKGIEHEKQCLEHIRFRKLIAEFKGRVMDFIKTHNNDVVLDAFYYSIPHDILCDIQAELEKKDVTTKKPFWFPKGKTMQDVFPDRYNDHSYFATGDRVIFEPYNTSKKAISALIETCDNMNLDFYVTGESKHFPAHTMRIEVFKDSDSTNVPCEHCGSQTHTRYITSRRHEVLCECCFSTLHPKAYADVKKVEETKRRPITIID